MYRLGMAAYKDASQKLGAEEEISLSRASSTEDFIAAYTISAFRQITSMRSGVLLIGSVLPEYALKVTSVG